jgi:hypothetical protein
MTTEMESAKKVIVAVYSAVKETGTKGMPSGHLYALLMQYGFTLDRYNNLIQGLCDLGFIRQEGYVLYAS